MFIINRNILICLYFLTFFIGCKKKETNNLSNDKQETNFFREIKLAFNNPEVKGNLINSWKIQIDLSCENEKSKEPFELRNLEFTSQGKEYLELPSGYSCTLKLNNFSYNDINHYTPINNNYYSIELSKNYEKTKNTTTEYIDDKKNIKLINASIVDNKVFFNRFESKEKASIYNNVEFSFIPIDEQYARLEIKNNSENEIDIKNLDFTGLNRSVSLIKYDYIRYYYHKKCTDSLDINLNSAKKLPKFSSCAIVFKTTNSEFGIHNSKIKINIDNILFSFNLSNKLFLYLAGEFTSPCNYIAKWDGNNYSCLTNMHSKDRIGVIHSLFQTPNGDLYAGGDLATTGVRMWDGNIWKNYQLPYLISAHESVVKTISIIHDYNYEPIIFVGGKFIPDLDNLRKSKNLAMYRTKENHWRNFNINTDGNINTISYSPDLSKLYLGGNFTENNLKILVINNLENILYPSIVEKPQLSILGSNLDGEVFHINPSTDGKKIYVAGEFNNTIDKNFQVNPNGKISKFAVWNWQEKKWNDLNGNGESTTGKIQTIKLPLDESNIYIGGDFKNLYTLSGKWGNFGRWNGLKWIVPNNNSYYVNYGVKTIAVSPNGETVYLGGNFKYANSYSDWWYLIAYNAQNSDSITTFPLTPSKNYLNGNINALELKNSWNLSID